MVQVTVIGNDVGQSLKVLKKKMQREGVFREMKLRRHHEKNSEKKPAVRPRQSDVPVSNFANAWIPKDSSYPERFFEKHRRNRRCFYMHEFPRPAAFFAQPFKLKTPGLSGGFQNI